METSYSNYSRNFTKYEDVTYWQKLPRQMVWMFFRRGPTFAKIGAKTVSSLLKVRKGGEEKGFKEDLWTSGFYCLRTEDV